MTTETTTQEAICLMTHYQDFTRLYVSICKAIPDNFLLGRLCRIEKSSNRLLSATGAFKFAEQHSGWMEVAIAPDAGMVPSVAGNERAVKPASAC